MSDYDNQAPMSFIQRLINIFVAPARVFQELAIRPTWVVPLVVISLYVPLLQTIAFSSARGQEALRQEMMKDPRTSKMTPEQMETYLGISRYIVPGTTLVALPVLTFAAAGVVYFVFSIILGGEATYRQALSAWTHTGLIGLLGGAVQIGLVIVKGSLSANTSLAAFLPFLEENTFPYRLLQVFDFFLIWQLAVLSIGMGIMSKVGTKKAAISLFTCLAILAVVIAGIRQAFS